MKKLLVALALFFLGAQQSRTVPVVLISIDGLMPEQLLNPDRHALKIPNLRRLVSQGNPRGGVKGVLPTVTYPSHTTMVTGVAPAKHGIHANTPFDPFGKNLDGWYWYAEDIKVETLWDVLRKFGMTTASVDWPVSVGAPIDFNIAQYWRAGLAEDVKVIRALSTPGLLAEAQRAIGASYPDGNDYTVAADERRAAFNTFILERKRPRFMTVYFSGLDHTQHETTAGSAESRQALEVIDGLVGKVRAAAESAGEGRAVICVVSDHGFARTERELHLNSALREAGLIRLDEAGKVAAWEAFSWNSGGLGAIMLRNAQDTKIARPRPRSLAEAGKRRLTPSSPDRRRRGSSGHRRIPECRIRGGPAAAIPDRQRASWPGHPGRPGTWHTRIPSGVAGNELVSRPRGSGSAGRTLTRHCRHARHRADACRPSRC